MNCLFCKIAKKEIPDAVIYEDAGTVAFLDVNPRSPGHTVVISRNHSQNILDLNDEDLAPLFLTVKKITAKLKRALNPAGFTIGINHGSAAGQFVDHLHVHVIPRFEDDGGGSIHSVVANPPSKSLEEIKSLITTVD